MHLLAKKPNLWVASVLAFSTLPDIAPVEGIPVPEPIHEKGLQMLCAGARHISSRAARSFKPALRRLCPRVESEFARDICNSCLPALETFDENPDMDSDEYIRQDICYRDPNALRLDKENGIMVDNKVLMSKSDWDILCLTDSINHSLFGMHPDKMVELEYTLFEAEQAKNDAQSNGAPKDVDSNNSKSGQKALPPPKNIPQLPPPSVDTHGYYEMLGQYVKYGSVAKRLSHFYTAFGDYSTGSAEMQNLRNLLKRHNGIDVEEVFGKVQDVITLRDQPYTTPSDGDFKSEQFYDRSAKFSTLFAYMSSGDVHAMLGQYKINNGVFSRFELPILLLNPNVENIYLYKSTDMDFTPKQAVKKNGKIQWNVMNEIFGEQGTTHVQQRMKTIGQTEGPTLQKEVKKFIRDSPKFIESNPSFEPYMLNWGTEVPIPLAETQGVIPL